MGITERRNSEKVKMKKLIMDAAIRIINQEGYENLSIRKISSQIEYSPTTVYLYYKDKAEIIQEMANELYQKVEADSMTALEKYESLPVAERLEKVLLEFINSLVREPEMAKSIMRGSLNAIFANGKESELPNNPGLIALEQVLRSGVEQEVCSPDILGTSWMLASALLGFILCAIENQLYMLEQFEHLSKQFVHLLLKGVIK